MNNKCKKCGNVFESEPDADAQGAEIACPFCGEKFSADAFADGNVNNATSDSIEVADVQKISPCSRMFYVMLALFLGIFGVHNYYSGHYKSGVMKTAVTLLLALIGFPLILIIYLICIYEVFTVKKDAEGRIMTGSKRCVVSVGICMILIVGTLLVCGIYALYTVIEDVRRMSCVSNLKHIGVAMKLYADGNGGFFPDKDNWSGFDEMALSLELPQRNFFVCPGSKKTVAKVGEKLSPRTVSYYYFGGLTSESVDPNIVLVVDMPGNHRRFLNVLYLDGSVSMYEPLLKIRTCEDTMRWIYRNDKLDEVRLRQIQKACEFDSQRRLEFR